MDLDDQQGDRDGEDGVREERQPFELLILRVWTAQLFVDTQEPDCA
jgi:hypothetical protein